MMNIFMFYILFAIINMLILFAFDTNIDRHFYNEQNYALPFGVYLFFSVTSFFTTGPLIVAVIVGYFTYYITKQ